MPIHLAHVEELLARTPATLRSLLAGISDFWLHATYGEDTFSPDDIVGHLIAGEQTDWMVRTRLILEHADSVPFLKYDRYAQFEASRGKTIDNLLDEFDALRTANLASLRELRLTPADLDRRGRHSALGPVTLGQLLATWAAHDLNHLAQIAKAMATRYESEVGPWRQYLGILRSPVTGMDPEGAARRRAAMGGQAPGEAREARLTSASHREQRFPEPWRCVGESGPIDTE